jgi:hypothetical protein
LRASSLGGDGAAEGNMAKKGKRQSEKYRKSEENCAKFRKEYYFERWLVLLASVVSDLVRRRFCLFPVTI